MAATVASELTGKTISCVMDLHTNMQMLGGRRPFEATYSAGMDEDGTITGVEMNLYANTGAT